jgi:hypothetical protein
MKETGGRRNLVTTLFGIVLSGIRNMIGNLVTNPERQKHLVRRNRKWENNDGDAKIFRKSTRHFKNIDARIET